MWSCLPVQAHADIEKAFLEFKKMYEFRNLQ